MTGSKEVTLVLSVIFLLGIGIGAAGSMVLVSGGDASASASSTSQVTTTAIGGTPFAIGTAPPNESTSAPSPTPASGTQRVPETPAQSSTPIPTQSQTVEQTTSSSAAATRPTQTPIAPRYFLPGEIQTEILALVNDARVAEAPLSTDTTTSNELEELATAHSERMATHDVVAHTVDGVGSADRYREAGLFTRCQFASDTGGFVVTAHRNRLEVVGHTVAGRPYTVDGQERFNENESAVAEAIVTDWLADEETRQHLRWDNAEHIGIGVEVTGNGEVYVTITLC